MKNRRLLVSAYGCEPAKGSEQGVGWNWVLQLAGLAELVVVTRSNNQDAIEAALPAELKTKVRFEYYDLPASVRRIKRKEKGLYPYYLLWQWGAYGRARKLLLDETFDYVMHLTFGSIWMPTFMHRLGLPFIWGPVGGGEAVPWRLIPSLPLRGRVLQYLRYCLMASFCINPLFMGVTRRARIILARTGDTAKLIPSKYNSKVRVVLETAVNEEWLAASAEPGGVTDSGGPVEVTYTGRLVAFKNVALAIKSVAIARRRGANLRLRIVGDGPLRSALKALAINEGISEYVTFTGMIPQAEVLTTLLDTDIYLLPSLREGGVWSLMEAMALGLPAVCVNTSGMSVIADTKSAILVAPHSQQQMIEDFSLALQNLEESPELRQELGRQARLRVETHFRWQHKGDFMAKLFNEMEMGEGRS